MKLIFNAAFQVFLISAIKINKRPYEYEYPYVKTTETEEGRTLFDSNHEFDSKFEVYEHEDAGEFQASKLGYMSPTEYEMDMPKGYEVEMAKTNITDSAIKSED